MAQQNHLLLKTKAICPQNAEIVTFASKNQHRPEIKQIGHSIDDIERHVLQAYDVNVYPETDCGTRLEKILYQGLEKQSSRGIVYISNNLSVVLNVETQPQPEVIIYDVCILNQGKPPTVLSVTTKREDDKLAKRYNISLAREIVQAVRTFTSEPFNVVFGLIEVEDLNSEECFSKRMNKIITKTSGAYIPDSLSMVGEKYKRIIHAFLSSIALTSSVVNVDNNDTLWFLTLEQFCILTENIDQKQVTVRTAPSSGGKVLMREVAKRLGRSGPTLLIMESEEQIQAARNLKICSFMKTGEEWRDMQDRGEHIEGLTNLVTNCQDCPTVPGITGKTWTFISVSKLQTLATVDKQTTQEETGNAIPSVRASNDPSELLRRKEELGRSKAEEINQCEIRIRELQEVKRQQENDLINKDSEIEKMREEIKAAKQTEEELNRLLDSASLGGLSLESGFLSDTRSMVSWSSTSTSASSLSLDTQGATGGHVKSKSRLRNLLKRIPGRKKGGANLAIQLKNTVSRLENKGWAESTKSTYRSQLKCYLDFCDQLKIEPMPLSVDRTQMYIAYLVDYKHFKFATVRQYLSIVSNIHKANNYPDPVNDIWCIQHLLRGVRRELGDEQHGAAAITPDMLLMIKAQLNLQCVMSLSVWVACLIGVYGM